MSCIDDVILQNYEIFSEKPNITSFLANNAVWASFFRHKFKKKEVFFADVVKLYYFCVIID